MLYYYLKGLTMTITEAKIISREALEVLSVQQVVEALWLRDENGAGLSAYEVAVKAGYTGTIDEWLLFIKGEKGDTGEIAKIDYDILFQAFIASPKEILEALREETTTLLGISSTIPIKRSNAIGIQSNDRNIGFSIGDENGESLVISFNEYNPSLLLRRQTRSINMS